MNAWNLEDDITRIGSKAEDFLSGIWSAESRISETGSRWKMQSDMDASDPFRRFHTPAPNRTSPTPLADLYSQSIDQAEVNSESWGQSERTESVDFSVPEEGCPQNVNAQDVECMPQDLFSFSQQEAPQATESSLETLNSSLTEPQEKSSVEAAASSVEKENKVEDTPQLIVDETASEKTVKRPLLSLSVGMSICGVGLVFGAQIMHNTAVVNPGKSLIIAGLIGLFVSAVFQLVKWFGRRKTA